MQMDEIAVAAVLGLVIGLVLGWLIGWVVGRMGTRAEKQRADQLTEDLKQRTDALTAAQTSLGESRQKLADAEKEHGERNAQQRERIAALDAQLKSAEKDAEKAASYLEEARAENTRLRGQLSQTQTELATLQTELKGERENPDRFKALADAILKENSKTFTEQNQTNIGNLLDPMNKALTNLQTATTALEVKREGAYGAVLTEIKNIQETHQGLRRETSQLVQALRAPKSRGNWGELQLKRCIEFAGMVEHASFDTEVAVQGDDASIRPDCVVHLPNNRTIVIDAKTPFDAYLDATKCADESERANLLSAHAARVRDHLSRLSAKAYWKQFKDSPDFVVCFLPSEVLFSAALEQDPGLIEFGSNSGVILATPTTLIALLKAVAYGWQQMEITRNAIAIREAGQKLYDKLATAQDYFNKMGKALDSSVRHYNSLIGCVEGKNSIFAQARKLHELGIGQDELADVQPLEAVTRNLQGEDWAQPEHPEGLKLVELVATMEESEPAPAPKANPPAPVTV